MPSSITGTWTFISLVHGDALQVDVDEAILDRLVLPVDDHHLGFDGGAGDFQVEDRVMTRLGVQDAEHLLGIELDGLRGLFRAIDDGWNFALNANPACGVLVEFSLAGSCCYYFRIDGIIFLSGTSSSF